MKINKDNITVFLEAGSQINNKHFVYEFTFKLYKYKDSFGSNFQQYIGSEEIGTMQISRLDNDDLYNDIENINGCESFYDFIGKDGIEEEKICDLLNDKRYLKYNGSERVVFVVDYIKIDFNARGNKIFGDVLQFALHLIGARKNDIIFIDAAPHYFSDFDDEWSEEELKFFKEKLKRYYESVGFKKILEQKNTNVMISLVEDIQKYNSGEVQN